MQDNDQRPLTIPWEHLLSLILVVGLYLMYSSAFLTDYLMNDELNFIAGRLSTHFMERFAPAPKASTLAASA